MLNYEAWPYPQAISAFLMVPCTLPCGIFPTYTIFTQKLVNFASTNEKSSKLNIFTCVYVCVYRHTDTRTSHSPIHCFITFFKGFSIVTIRIVILNEGAEH